MTDAERSAIEQAMATIDRLDADLVLLLSSRFVASRLIGEIKRRRGAPLFDPDRISSQRAKFIGDCTRAGLDAGLAERVILAITDRVIQERRTPSAPDRTSQSEAR